MTQPDTSTVEDDLKPCPFCGGAAELMWDDNYDYEQHFCWRVRCHWQNECDVEPVTCGYKKDEQDIAIKAWNKRAA